MIDDDRLVLCGLFAGIPDITDAAQNILKQWQHDQTLIKVAMLTPVEINIMTDHGIPWLQKLDALE